MRRANCNRILYKFQEIVLVTLFLSPVVLGQTGAIQFTAEVPMLDCDGTPCVEAQTVDGKTWRLGIDTGNANSVLDSKVAEASGLKPTKPTPAGWPAGMFETAAPGLKIGSISIGSLPVLAMNLSDDIGKGTMPHVDGTLAYTAFKDRAIELDFAARKLRISDVLTQPVDCGKTCDKFSLITFGKHGPPIVVAQGFEIDGKSFSAQVDTMYTGSLLVYTASIEKLGLAESAKSTAVREFLLTDGGVKMKEAAAKRESFHGLTLAGTPPKVYFPTEGVHEPDRLFDATVGLEVFEGKIVSLNFHNNTISVR